MKPAEVWNFLKSGSMLKHLPRRTVWITYDGEAGVVYINFYNPPREASDSELIDDDVLFRYGKESELIGITVTNVFE